MVEKIWDGKVKSEWLQMFKKPLIEDVLKMRICEWPTAATLGNMS